MDSAIRTLLAHAEQKENKDCLQDAFSKLRCGRTTSDKADPFHSDLYVICAEVSFKLGNLEIVKECMKLFFQKTPPTNQFLGRAYLCQAQMCSPTTSAQKSKLQKSVGYLIKAISFAKSSERYYFLVYNASVLYWAFSRPFMKPNYRYVLAKSFHLVVKALDETNDPDFEWRAQLMIALMECHIDAGRRDDALHVGTAAMQFMKANVPHKCKEIFLLQLQYKLLEPPKIQGFIKVSPELAFTYKMHKVKGQSDHLSASQITDLDKLYRSIVDGEDGGEPRHDSGGSRVPLPLTSTERDSLLLDLTRLCIDLELPNLATQCVNTLKKSSAMDERKFYKVEFLSCEMMVVKLKENQESYSKLAIERRIGAIEILSEHLLNANRISDENLVQIGCVTMWNLCLPLLQNNLRYKVYKHLLLAVNLLEDIDSLLSLQRCQMHTELAKCEEQREQLQSAINHLLKALSLDDSGTYKNRLEHSLNRMRLKALLYQEPNRAEDHAAMIIEQVEYCCDSTKIAKMQVYISKAGMLLAPDSFMLAMDGEAAFHEATFGQCSVEMLAKRVQAFEKGLGKIVGHLKRLEGTNEKERIKLWADLVKVSRKQNVWDVTRIAARFCLLYEEERLKTYLDYSLSKNTDSKTVITSSTPTTNNAVVERGVISREELAGMEKFSENDDIIRLFADVNFIFAESLVQLLQTEGIKLMETPLEPKDTKLRPKKYKDNPILTTDMEEWKVYSEWIDKTTKEALNRFQAACNHGVLLNNSLIVCNAAMYVWNYTKHLLEKKEYSMLTKQYLPLFNSLRKVGHGSETVFLCDFGHALAQGFMKQHISKVNNPSQKRILTPVAPTPIHGSKKSGKGGVPSHQNVNKGKGAVALVANVEGANDLQQALDILDFLLTITSGSDAKNMVPIDVRHQIIKTHVLCRGLMNQNFPKNYGNENESQESQGAMSRALCALETLSVHCTKVAEFSPVPTVKDVIQRVENAKWTDNLLLLQVWSRLAAISLHNGDYVTSMNCCNTALDIGNGKNALSEKSSKKNEKFQHDMLIEQELLYYTCIMKGQCLVATMNGRNEIRRAGLDSFVDACRFASNAKNYELVMCAVRHYWNNIHPLISIPIERQLLIEPIRSLLMNIKKVSKEIFNEIGDDEKRESEKGEERQETSKPIIPENVKQQSGHKRSTSRVSTSTTSKNPISERKTTANTVNTETQLNPTQEKKKKLDEDLQLRAALYGVLFQTCADKGYIEDGLSAMDEAIKVLPRTHHRLVIFKHRIITQAKLNKPIQFDMGKFRDENESLLAQMWHRVAKNSKNKSDQLSAYLNAIDVLITDDYLYQKIDYLAEFSEWLFVNGYPQQMAIDQLSYAIMLLSHNYEQDGSVITQLAQLSDLTDLKQMDALLRMYVMISEMVGCQNEIYQQYNLVAAALIKQMWKTALINVEKAIRSGIKPGESSSPKGKKPAKERNERFGSDKKSTLPSTVEEWAKYHVSDKFKEYFKADPHGSFLSKKSIEKPMLSFYYCENLYHNLCSLGFDHVTVRILAFMMFIAEDLACSSSLKMLTHAMFADLCEKLNLTTAYNYHQEFLEKVELTEDEQAESREEVEIWKEKQRQVLLEEQRQGGKGNIINSFSSFDQLLHGKHVVKGSSKREVWVRLAGYLIERTQYKQARLFLEEAYISAVAFNDVETCEMINYNYAVIAYQTGDWGRVVRLFNNMKHITNKQLFWLKKVNLLVDALHKFSRTDTTFQSQINDAGFDKAKKALQNALGTVEVSLKKRPNSAFHAPYLKAKLLYRLATLYYTESKEKVPHRTQEYSLQLQHAALKYMTQSFALFKQFGYKIESVKVACVLTEMEINLVIVQNNREEKKSSLVRIFHSALKSVQDLLKHLKSITLVTPEYETVNVFIPLQKLLIKAKKSFFDVMHRMIYLELEEKKEQRLMEEAKQGIERVIDNYVDIGKTLSPSEKEWQAAISIIPQEAVALLSFSKVLSCKIPRLTGEMSLNVGILLDLLASYNCADRYDWWGSDENSEIASELSSTSSAFPTKKDQIMYPCLDVNIRVELENFKLHKCEAVDSLTQALQIGLQHSLVTLVQGASYRLLECMGRFEPYNAVQMLALYQSSQTSLKFHSLLDRVFINPNTSASASLFMQHHHLKDTIIPSNLLQSTHASLMEYEWWKRLCISKTHFDIVKEIPFSITYVILQHSPDHKSLYAGVFEKINATTAGKNKRASRSSIARIGTTEKIMNDLMDMLREFQLTVGSELMKQVYFEQQQDQRRDLLDDKDECHEIKEVEIQNKKEGTKKTKDMFDALLIALEAYLVGALNEINNALMIDPIPQTVMILADEFLLQFPLECISVFQKPQIQSIGRDFSLQVFHHRLKRGERGENTRQSKMEHKGGGQGKGKQEKPTKGEKQSTAGKSKAPAEKKVELKEFVIENDAIQLDLSNLVYVLDPFGDEEKVLKQPEAIIEELQILFKHKLSKWSGLKGPEEIPNTKTIQALLHTSPAFMFCGFERFLATMPAFTLLPLNLSECFFVFLLDLVQTSHSHQRQGKLDSLKSTVDLKLENSVHTAMFLSLCGVSTIALNQWHTEWKYNKKRLQTVFNGFFDSSLTLAQTIRCLHKIQKEITKTLIAEEEGDKCKQSKKRKKSIESPVTKNTSRADSVSRSTRGDVLHQNFSTDEKCDEMNNENMTGEKIVEEKKMFFEDYNLVVYGLPGFITS